MAPRGGGNAARATLTPPRDPTLWPRPLQYAVALAVAATAWAASLALQPALDGRLPWLPLLAALTALLPLVRPGPFVAAALLGGAGIAWRSPQPLGDFALVAAALLPAALAARWSSWVRDRRRAAREQAEEQREALRVTLASIGDAVVTADALGRTEFMNDAACQITGWRAADAAGRPIGEVLRLVDGDGRPALQGPADAVLASGEPVSPAGTVRLLRQDGDERPVEIRATPIRTAHGALAGAVMVFRDVGERLRAERRRHADEERFHTMADSAPVLIWTSGRDMGGSWFNHHWLAFTGRALDDELGTGWTTGLHPDDRERVLAAIAHAFDVRQPFTIDFRLRRHDGEYRWLMDHGAPLRDDDGHFAGYIGAAVDITDRKDAEAALQRSEALFRRIAEADLVGVGFSDAQGRLGYANDEMLRMMGRHRDEVDAGTIDWQASQAPEFASLAQRIDGVLRDRGVVSSFEGAFLRPDGSRTPYLGATALLDENGSGQRVSIALDLTALKQAEQSRALLLAQLRDADRRKDQFLATLAHELRNPLAPVLHGMAVLAHADPATAARAQAAMQRQLQHMVRLVDDLLDVGRIAHDRLELRRVPLTLGAVLEQAVETVRPTFEANGQRLQVDVATTPLWLQADAVRLVQVFSNLLGNAAKYSAPGSAVTLRVQRPAVDTVEVAVQDQGIGIAPALLPRVFEMFTQGDPAPGQASRGLGIGLALAQRLVQLHGGEIEAHSDGPGQGSRFVVRLPLIDGPVSVSAPVPAPIPAPPAPPDEPAPAGSGWRILVVDDNRDAASTLALLLQMGGHQTRMAHDGPQALHAAAEFEPHAVLLDIGLPGFDGHEVARRLRARPGGHALALLALTGWGQDLDREASREAGFDTHLVKPVPPELLLQRLQSLLEPRGPGGTTNGRV